MATRRFRNLRMRKSRRVFGGVPSPRSRSRSRERATGSPSRDSVSRYSATRSPSRYMNRSTRSRRSALQDRYEGRFTPSSVASAREALRNLAKNPNNRVFEDGEKNYPIYEIQNRTSPLRDGTDGFGKHNGWEEDELNGMSWEVKPTPK